MEGTDAHGDVFQALLYSWGTMLGDSPALSPRLTSGRVLFGGWLVVSLVLCTAYRSSLIAHLTVVIKQPPIDSFDDLVKQQAWTWGIKPSTGSIYLYFTFANDPIRKEVNRKMQYHTMEEGMKRLLRGRHSFIANKYKAIIAVRSRYTFESGYTPVHISTSTYPVFAGGAWGFRKGAPFRYSISFLKQRLIEAGLIDHWMEEAVAATTEAEIQEGGGRLLLGSSQEEPEGGSHVVLSLPHLQGIFYFLGLGFLSSSLVFGLEVFGCQMLSY